MESRLPVRRLPRPREALSVAPNSSISSSAPPSTSSSSSSSTFSSTQLSSTDGQSDTVVVHEPHDSLRVEEKREEKKKKKKIEPPIESDEQTLTMVVSGRDGFDEEECEVITWKVPVRESLVWMNTSTEQVCIHIREECRCICGHRLKEHRGLGGMCTTPRCPCRKFFYIVAEGSWILRCSCKHKHTEHECNPPYRCKRQGCSCQQFFSPWVCNCDTPWSGHETQRKLLPLFDPGDELSQVGNPLAVQRGEYGDDDSSSSTNVSSSQFK